jgi:uncharacterized protein YegL
MESIDRDVKKGVLGWYKGDWEPVVFIFLAGMPTDNKGKADDKFWQISRSQIIDRPKGKITPSSIIAVKCSTYVHDNILKKINTANVTTMNIAELFNIVQYYSQY